MAGFVRIINEKLSSPDGKAQGITLISYGESSPEDILPIIKMAFHRARNFPEQKRGEMVLPHEIASLIITSSLSTKENLRLEKPSFGIHSLRDEIEGFCSFYYRLNQHPKLPRNADPKRWDLEVRSKIPHHFRDLRERYDRDLILKTLKGPAFRKFLGYEPGGHVQSKLKLGMYDFDEYEFTKNPSPERLISLLPKLTLEEHFENLSQGQYSIFSGPDPYDNC
ncbi:MAG: hypothetical protein AABX93_00005 [Nanoarchaeota archaeon]